MINTARRLYFRRGRKGFFFLDRVGIVDPGSLYVTPSATSHLADGTVKTLRFEHLILQAQLV